MSQKLEELRAAAEAEWATLHSSNPPTPEPEVEVPVEPESPTEPEAPSSETPVLGEPEIEEVHLEQEPPKPTVRRVVYKKIVDLGDGNPQVFKAATKDELIDKILEAQLNASKRIKELKAENKVLKQSVQPDQAQPVRNIAPRSLSKEEEESLVDELQTAPTAAIKKAVEALLGQSMDEYHKDQADLRTFRQKTQIQEIGQKFIESHPEYPITAANEKLMAEYIQKNHLAWTLKNLELAFTELQEAGLVTAKAVSVPESVQEGIVEEEEPEVVAPNAPAPRPVEPVVPTQPAPASDAVPRRRKAVVGVSSRQSVAADAQETPHEVSVEELLKLSPEERRRIVFSSSGRQA